MLFQIQDIFVTPCDSFGTPCVSEYLDITEPDPNPQYNDNRCMNITGRKILLRSVQLIETICMVMRAVRALGVAI